MRIACLFTLALSALLLLGCRATAPPPQSLSTMDWEQRVTVGIVPSGIASAEDEEAANRVVEEKLQRRCTVNFDENTLGSVLEFVRDVSGVSMAENWVSLDLVGIEPDLPITLRLDHVPIAQLLSIVLEQASAEQFDGDKAGYAVYQGVVMIDTRANIKQYTVLRVYDARLLIEADRWDWVEWYVARATEDELREFIESWQKLGFNSRSASEALGLNASGGRNGSPPGGRRFSDAIAVPADQGPTEAQREHQFRAKIIRWLIEDSVGDIDEWLDEDSTISEIDGYLVVKTTRENQRAIRELLIELYKKQAELSR